MKNCYGSNAPIGALMIIVVGGRYLLNDFENKLPEEVVTTDIGKLWTGVNIKGLLQPLLSRL